MNGIGYAASVLLLTAAAALGLWCAAFVRKRCRRAAEDALLLAMSRNRYEVMQHNQEQLRHARHDMIHHLKLLEGLAAQDDLEAVKRYLAELLKDVEAARLADLCRSRVGDLVLSWYEREAGDAGVEFVCNADIPQERPDASTDLCAVLSNALQNSVEACKTVEGKRFIRVAARPAGATLLLTVENSCAPGLTVGENLPATTKGGEGHGVGLSSIKAIARRHSGYFKLSAVGGVFTLSVALGDMF